MKPAMAFLYEFEWDPTKSKANSVKHGVDFRNVTQVFLDPLALTILDEEHSGTEVRWITLGRDKAAKYVLIVHTFEQISDDLGRIRVISARRPTRSEVLAYEEER
jgi:uncharacterized protein